MDNKNLFMAIAVSLAILFGWQFFVEGPRQEAQLVQQERQAAIMKENLKASDKMASDGSIQLPPDVNNNMVNAKTKPRNEVISSNQRVKLTSQNLSGSINLGNGRIDDIVMEKYRSSIDPNSNKITLLSPTGSINPYFAEFGWIGSEGTFGGSGTNWQTDTSTLKPGTPVVLTAQTKKGMGLKRTYSLDDKFMFTIIDTVKNNSDKPIYLQSFARLVRVNTPDTLGFFILHEGPIGVIDGTLREIKYSSLKDDYDSDNRKPQPTTIPTTGGWLGITDKYWLTAVIPDQNVPVNASFSYQQTSSGADLYQTDVLEKNVHTVMPGASVKVTNRLFAGAKVFDTLTEYRDEQNVPRLEMAIDFGWFFFITKPLLQVLIVIAEQLANIGIKANFGVAILVVTVILKIFFFPLANKSYKSMSKMKALQPKMTELREKYGDDKRKMQQELMGMYKREKVNPVSGCLPMVLQIPVFFALYKVLFTSIEMRQSPFYGWVHDLSERDPTNIFQLFGLIPWDVPSFLAAGTSFVALGLWPLFMGISMFLQQKLNPAPADPIQAKMFMLMPLMFMFFLANFPVGLVIYWTWNNCLSVAQQYVIMRRMGVSIGGGTIDKGTKTT
jgi:YidC/Oxa1 family membrane protein insertase|tara:strand:+ start:11048 stop:12883 length:1836 start_codon:yes stop_codon:yes gene_type:complete